MVQAFSGYPLISNYSPRAIRSPRAVLGIAHPLVRAAESAPERLLRTMLCYSFRIGDGRFVTLAAEFESLENEIDRTNDPALRMALLRELAFEAPRLG